MRSKPGEKSRGSTPVRRFFHEEFFQERDVAGTVPPLMLQNILFRFVPLSKLVLLRWIWVMLGKA
jgi:hypothetical protein